MMLRRSTIWLSELALVERYPLAENISFFQSEDLFFLVEGKTVVGGVGNSGTRRRAAFGSK